MAEALKEEGNAFFKANQFPQAIAKYTEGRVDSHLFTTSFMRITCEMHCNSV